MTFKPGHKLAKGRPKGSPNKRTQQVEETTDRLGVNPFEILLMFAKGDWEGLGYDSSVIVKQSSDGSGSTFVEYTISPELRAACAEKACKYLYPIKKSIEHIKPNMLDGMTPEEKLEAMRQAVKMLEGELNSIPREVKPTNGL